MTATQNPWLQAESQLRECDPVIRVLIDKYGPCRIRPQSDYFASLCKSIVSQQLATKAAAAIFGRFSEYFEGKFTPQKIAATPPAVFRELGLSGQKTAYITDLAAKFLDGHLTPADFAAMDEDAIVSQLVSVKGIGVWTAQMFLIFALNRPDILPTDDYGIKKAIMQQYDLGSPPDKAKMEAIALPWRPFRSIASWYLWRSLENA
jgi:DNA-3-methyladenine glycosylase II